MMKFGKRIGNSVYVHFEAIECGSSVLSKEEVEFYYKSKNMLKDCCGDFLYDFICSSYKNGKIRFLKMSSLLEAHPFVVDSKIVFGDLIRKGHLNRQIYHRLDLILGANHNLFDFHKKIAEYEIGLGLYGKDAPKKSYGYLKHWVSWVETKVDYDQYLKNIENIKNDFLENIRNK